MKNKIDKIVLLALLVFSLINPKTVSATDLSTSYASGYSNWSTTKTNNPGEQSAIFYRYANATAYSATITGSAPASGYYKTTTQYGYQDASGYNSAQSSVPSGYYKKGTSTSTGSKTAASGWCPSGGPTYNASSYIPSGCSMTSSYASGGTSSGCGNDRICIQSSGGTACSNYCNKCDASVNAYGNSTYYTYKPALNCCYGATVVFNYSCTSTVYYSVSSWGSATYSSSATSAYSSINGTTGTPRKPLSRTGYQEVTEWGSWSAWQSSSVSKTISRKVESATFYSYPLRTSVGAKPTTSVSKTYNGSSQSNEYSTPSGVTMTGNNSGTNAGTYTATYTPDSSHKWSDDSTGSVTVTLTINKATPSVTAPTAKSLTYNGSAQTLINAGSTTGGTIQYKLGSGSYSTSLPTATNAGTYTVYYKVVGNGNYNDVAEKSITVTINKKSLTIPSLTNTSKTYNGSSQSPTVNNYASGTMTQGGTASATNVGTYSVTWSLKDTANYQWSDGTTTQKSASWSIDRASVGAKPTTTVTKTYNGSAQTNGYTTPTGVTMTGNNSGTNVGTYTATYTPDSNHKWSDGTTTGVSVTLTINKATPSLVFNDENMSDTFGGVTKTKTINGASGNAGTLSYELTSQKSGSTNVSYFSLNGTTLTIKPNTPAGTYTISVKATDAGNGNYNSTSKTKNIALTISALTVKFNGNGGTGSMDDFGITKADDELPGVNFYKDGYTFIGWKIE